MPILLRATKGSKLTYEEGDTNWAEKITMVGHPFDIGDVVYRDTSTTVAFAQANLEATLADGIVCDRQDDDTIWVVVAGGIVVPWSSHGLGSLGTKLWLSQTVQGGIEAGADPYPTGWALEIGKVWDTDNVLWRPREPKGD